MDWMATWAVAEEWSAAQAGRATAGTMAFLAAPPWCRWCGEGTVFNHAFLWQDFEVARVVLVDLRFHCPLQLEVLGMVEDEKNQKENPYRWSRWREKKRCDEQATTSQQKTQKFEFQELIQFYARTKKCNGAALVCPLFCQARQKSPKK